MNQIGVEKAPVGLRILQHPFFLIILILFVIFLLYIPSLDVPPYMDDYIAIFMNPQVTDLANLRYVVKDYLVNRGLVQISFALDWHLFPDNLAVMHLVNIAWHLLATGLTWICVKNLWRLFYYPDSSHHPLSPYFGILAAAFFGIHPINTQPTTYLVARADIMATVFFLLGVILACKMLSRAERGKTRGRWRLAMQLFGLSLGTGAFTAAGLGCKEIIITLPAVVLLQLVLFWRKEPLRTITFRSFLYCLPMIAAVTGYLTYRIMVLGAVFGFSDVQARSPMENFLTQICIMVFYYLPRVVLPFKLLFAPSFPTVDSWTDPRLYFSFAVILSIVGTGIYSLRKRPEIGFGILWFFVTLAPTSSFIPLWDLVAERRIYLPLIGLGLIVESAALPLLLSRNSLVIRRTAALLAVFVLLFAYLTVRRNMDYRDPVQFWYREVNYSPDSLSPFHSLIYKLAEEGRNEEAVEAFKRIDWEKIQQHKVISGERLDFLIRFMLIHNIDLNRATRMAESHVSIHPESTTYLATLQYAYMKQSRWEEAMAVVQKTLRISPWHLESLVNQATLYLLSNENDKALESLQLAVKYYPNDTMGWTALADYYDRTGKDSSEIRRKIETLNKQINPKYVNTKDFKTTVGGETP
ncbi:MAG: tetratricopeptide repeat protein [bacterium]